MPVAFGGHGEQLIVGYENALCHLNFTVTLSEIANKATQDRVGVTSVY